MLEPKKSRDQLDEKAFVLLSLALMGLIYNPEKFSSFDVGLRPQISRNNFFPVVFKQLEKFLCLLFRSSRLSIQITVESLLDLVIDETNVFHLSFDVVGVLFG